MTTDCWPAPALILALALLSAGPAAGAVVRSADLVSHCGGANGADDYCLDVLVRQLHKVAITAAPTPSVASSR
jgi:hypothetical protein